MERSEFDDQWKKAMENAEASPPESTWSGIESELERGEFDGSWKKAMEGAEAEPSPYSWSVIESELIASENLVMRSKVVFYQRLAAAMIVFAAMVGAMGFYYWKSNLDSSAELSELRKSNESLQALAASQSAQQSDESVLASQESGTKPATTVATETLKNEVRLSERNDEQLTQPFNTASPSTLETYDPKQVQFTSLETKPIVTSDVEYQYAMLSGAEQKVPSSAKKDYEETPIESPIKIQQKEETVALDGMSKEEENQQSELKKYKEDLWAGLSLSAGNYSPSTLGGGQQATQPTGFASRTASPVNTQSSVGSSFSVGLAVGKRVAERWVVLGGVNYLNQSQGYTTNLAGSTNNNQTAVMLANITTSSAVTITTPYQINSVLEYISVPLQAGYVIVDRKLGVQMNAGLASDFFLRNTLSDPSGQAQSYSQSAGADSPYRSINFAGLVSTELSLRLSRQYRISVVPGMRYMFNPSLKTGVNNPYMADIGFRFKYILR